MSTIEERFNVLREALAAEGCPTVVAQRPSTPHFFDDKGSPLVPAVFVSPERVSHKASTTIRSIFRIGGFGTDWDGNPHLAVRITLSKRIR